MSSIKYAWLNLVLAPVWFLLVIIIFSVYFSINGITETEIPLKISDNIPTLILFVQTLMLTTLYLSTKKDNFDIFKDGWNIPQKSTIYRELLYGLLIGSFISLLYLYALSPLQIFLQKNLGDYIPAGETIKGLGTQTSIFFIANVIFAPFVEENLYRNYTLDILLKNYNTKKAILLNSLLFGLLHWVGGFWYILMTGVFIGIPFSFIKNKRNSVVLVFMAHLTLNFIEFIYISKLLS